jgi:hypothetical protein
MLLGLVRRHASSRLNTARVTRNSKRTQYYTREWDFEIMQKQISHVTFPHRRKPKHQKPQPLHCFVSGATSAAFFLGGAFLVAVDVAFFAGVAFFFLAGASAEAAFGFVAFAAVAFFLGAVAFFAGAAFSFSAVDA